MCGIFVYIGGRPILVTLLEGLYRLEYRGYDGVGISLLKKSSPEIITMKIAGTVKSLDNLIRTKHPEVVEHQNDYVLGFGHTRWPTMGVATDVNTQPLWSNDRQWTAILNGIIENYSELTARLKKEGYHFETDNDVEVVPILLEYYAKKFPENDVLSTFVLTLQTIKGAYGVCIMHATEQNIYVARLSSPVCIGVGDGETFIASDPIAFKKITEKVIHVDDNEVVIVSKEGYRVHRIIEGKDGTAGEKENNTLSAVVQTAGRIITIPYEEDDAELGVFPHFMLKEINQQPKAISLTYAGKINNFQNIHITIPSKLRKVVFLGCGTSYYATLVGRHVIEMEADVPVVCEYASEFIYRKCLVGPDDLVIAVSQSGETADTYKAVQLAKDKNAQIAGIVNKVGSSIARFCEQGMYLHCGEEVGVASTKAFSCQICAMILLSALLKNDRAYDMALRRELQTVPEKITLILNKSPDMMKTIDEIVERYKDITSTLFLGRGICYPLALEGALKMKEISYVHAEGYPAGEMKHGPIALVDKGMPVFFILRGDDTLTNKVLNNMEEIKTRHGEIITVTDTLDNERIRSLSTYILTVPTCSEIMSPMLFVVPLQLIAYKLAVRRGLNPDRPRNLAKSVTVE